MGDYLSAVTPMAVVMSVVGDSGPDALAYDNPAVRIQVNAEADLLQLAPGGGSLRFTQTTASATFKNGQFAGRTIGDIAGALRSGAVKPSELSVGIITRDGNPLILNTRSSLALLRAGVSPADWTINDMTGDSFYEELLTQRLANNGLTSEGTDILRITGAGRWASWLG
jgi:hypothetical protein